MEQKLNREELASLEVGRTTVSRPLALTMVICFLLCIFLVPVAQMLMDSKNPQKQSMLNSFTVLFGGGYQKTDTVLQRNSEILSRMSSFEKELEENSFLRDLILVPGQRILLGLGAGNEKVYPGRENWLFYRPDMDYLIGGGFLDLDIQKKRSGEESSTGKKIQADPLLAIVEFRNQLQELGITLVLVPTPIKASLHPDYFALANYHGTLQNRSWNDFIRQLSALKIHLFDPAPTLSSVFMNTKEPVYLETDTHWRAAAMEQVAEQLADYLREKFGVEGQGLHLQRREKQVENAGDIDTMLLIPQPFSSYVAQVETIHPVLNNNNELWQSSPAADILLLGDSFSNIFSLAGMGWGESAGLAEQLSYYLDRDLDVLLQNDAGSYATREMLARELSRGRDRLEGKKIVIWQFAARELSFGDWKIIPMQLQEVAESDFFVPKPESPIRVSGVVASVSRSPLPGSVPYKDNLVTLHLVDMTDLDSGEELGQALVYGWGMQDNILKDFARLRVGERVEMNCVDWDDVQMDYSSYRRSSLDDEMLELELPVWGEIIK